MHIILMFPKQNVVHVFRFILLIFHSSELVLGMDLEEMGISHSGNQTFIQLRSLTTVSSCFKKVIYSCYFLKNVYPSYISYIL